MKEQTVIEDFINGMEKLTEDERIAIYKVLTSYITAYIRSENMPNDGVVGGNTETKRNNSIYMDLSTPETVYPFLQRDSVINDINNGIDYRKRLNDKLDKIIQQATRLKK